jgi:apolipoprotein N-acyltransferase
MLKKSMLKNSMTMTLARTLWLPILSGIFIGTSYIPFPAWAYPFCFVPLWIYWLRQNSWKKVFLGGWISQFVLTLIGFNWISYTAQEFGHLPYFVSLLVLLIYAAVANLYIPIAGTLWYFLVGKKVLPHWLKLLTLPCFVALGDLHLQTLFPWNYGYPWLHSVLPAYHLAEFIGFSGLSMVTIFSNVLLFKIWETRKQSQKLAQWVGLSVLLFFLINGLGYWRSQTLPKPDGETHFLLVQANIGNLEKQYAEKVWGFRDHILNRYTDLTRQGLSQEPKTNIVVWPETAFPDDLSNPTPLSRHVRRLKRFLREQDTYMITGGYGEIPHTKQATNSFFLLGPEGQFVDTPYMKTHLLAFGEYLPGAEWWPQIKSWLPQTADFARGPGPVLREIGDLKIGPQICYEVLFPHFSKKLADLDVHLFVNLTNDSWYGKWQQPYQHLYMSAARAVEFRRPLVRSTNTGFTTVVKATGEILERSPLHEEWFHTYAIPYYSQPFKTFFQRSFWLMPALLWLLTIVLVLVGRVVKGSPEQIKNKEANDEPTRLN